MKRITAALVASLAVATMAIAQPFGGGMMGGRPGYGYQGYAQNQQAPKATSLDGSLTFVDKVPALKAKDGIYLIRLPGFFRDAYFDGIKEGATLKLDGYLLDKLPGQTNAWFMVTKAVINGKTYDLTQLGGPGRGGFGGHGPGMMGGFGGRW